MPSNTTVNVWEHDPGNSSSPEGGKIIKRTVANLSHWDTQLVEHFRLLLKGGVAVESIDAVMTIERTLPHGHVAAVLGAARACGAEKWFASAPEELRAVLMAMLCARVLWPSSKLATQRMLHDDTATSSLGRVLGVGQCEVDELYQGTRMYTHAGYGELFSAAGVPTPATVDLRSGASLFIAQRPD